MLSVICPIYNEEKHIAKCIDSILSQDYPKDDLEIIFVDGISTDKTRDIVKEYIAKYHFIRLIDNPRRIVPSAMNIGVKASRGDIIIRLDAHAIFPSNYLSHLVLYINKLDAENVGGVCRTLPADDSIVGRSIAHVLSSRFGMGNSDFRVGADSIKEVDTVPFGCFRRDLFERIGYFDEELVRNQDDEFNGRIIKNGGKIYLLPHLVIDYYARDKISKVYKMFYQYGLFKPLVNKKLGSPVTIRQFFPLVFVLGLILGPMSFFVSNIFVWLYLSILCLYILLATYFSSKNSIRLKEVLIINWIYFIVHFAYGWGYINGILKIIFKSSFNVQSNR